MVAARAIMPLASNVASYAGMLAGLFEMAAGNTILQVAANPLAAVVAAQSAAISGLRSDRRSTRSAKCSSRCWALTAPAGARSSQLRRARCQYAGGRARLDRCRLSADRGNDWLLTVFIWAMRAGSKQPHPPLRR
jgi:hypothetical protein